MVVNSIAMEFILSSSSEIKTNFPHKCCKTNCIELLQNFNWIDAFFFLQNQGNSLVYLHVTKKCELFISLITRQLTLKFWLIIGNTLL